MSGIGWKRWVGKKLKGSIAEWHLSKHAFCIVLTIGSLLHTLNQERQRKKEKPKMKYKLKQ